MGMVPHGPVLVATAVSWLTAAPAVESPTPAVAMRAARAVAATIVAFRMSPPSPGRVHCGPDLVLDPAFLSLGQLKGLSGESSPGAPRSVARSSPVQPAGQTRSTRSRILRRR